MLETAAMVTKVPLLLDKASPAAAAEAEELPLSLLVAAPPQPQTFLVALVGPQMVLVVLVVQAALA